MHNKTVCTFYGTYDKPILFVLSSISISEKKNKYHSSLWEFTDIAASLITVGI